MKVKRGRRLRNRKIGKEKGGGGEVLEKKKERNGKKGRRKEKKKESNKIKNSQVNVNHSCNGMIVSTDTLISLNLIYVQLV